MLTLLNVLGLVVLCLFLLLIDRADLDVERDLSRYLSGELILPDVIFLFQL